MSIVEVSKAAGVSTATVSRVINNHPSVSAGKQRAVRDAMASLGYVPPPVERRYRRQRGTGRAVGGVGGAGGVAGEAGLGSGVGGGRGTVRGVMRGRVVLLFPDHRDQALRTALSGRLMHGVNDRLSGAGMHMIVSPLLPDGRVPSSIARREVDGVIVRGATDLSSVAEELKGAGLPVVWMLETGAGLPRWGDQVMEDTEEVGVLAAEYLAGRGCRRVVAVNEMPGHPSYPLRSAAFARAARGMGMAVRVMEEEKPVAAQLREGGEFEGGFDGVFLPMPDDFIGEAYRGLRAMGREPGRGLPFVTCSYDPARLAALDPELAYVDIRAETIATTAVEVLQWRVRNPGEARRRVIVGARLVVPGGEG